MSAEKKLDIKDKVLNCWLTFAPCQKRQYECITFMNCPNHIIVWPLRWLGNQGVRSLRESSCKACAATRQTAPRMVGWGWNIRRNAASRRPATRLWRGNDLLSEVQLWYWWMNWMCVIILLLRMEEKKFKQSQFWLFVRVSVFASLVMGELGSSPKSNDKTWNLQKKRNMQFCGNDVRNKMGSFFVFHAIGRWKIRRSKLRLCAHSTLDAVRRRGKSRSIFKI